MYSFDKLLYDIVKLEYEEIAILTDILYNRKNEEERLKIKEYADKIKDEYNSVFLKRQTSKEAINYLHQYMDS